MPQVKADNAQPDTPTLYEVSPNSAQEQIIDVKVTNVEEGKTPFVLTPTDELTTVRFVSQLFFFATYKS